MYVYLYLYLYLCSYLVSTLANMSNLMRSAFPCHVQPLASDTSVAIHSHTSLLQPTRAFVAQVLETLLPDIIPVRCLRQAAVGAAVPEKLAKLDECHINSARHYKVGVLHCRQGQVDEDDMYNNQGLTPALAAFLDAVGDRVRLKG